MNRPSFSRLLTDRRTQTYLVWLLIVTAGWVLTHLRMSPEVNIGWGITVLFGLGFMVYAMPLRQRRMQSILAIWTGILLFGMAASAAAFYSPALGPLISYLGVFWLLLLAVAFALNGLVDPPSRWYYVASALHVMAAGAAVISPWLLYYQYLLAAAAAVLGMGGLWLFRSLEP